MSTINVTDQYAAGSINTRKAFAGMNTPVIETALQHVNLVNLSVRTAAVHGVSFCEAPVTGLLVLRARGEKNALQAALKSVLSLALPDALQSTADTNEIHCVRWVAPDEWMLSCPIDEAFDIENRLRASLGDKSAAIVNVSGGYTLLRLSGPHANDVLKKSTAYDVHPAHFAPGKVVNTVFAKAQVTMRCIDAGDYELIVRRSFADYLWHWVQVAAREYGLGIVFAEASK